MVTGPPVPVTSFQDELGALAQAVSGVAAPQVPTAGYMPPVPQSLEDTGLTHSMLEQLILKTVHFRGEIVGRELANCLGLRYSLIDPVVDQLKRHRLIEVKGSLGYGNISAVFTLSEAGRLRAREHLAVNQYCGAAPVPIAQYAQAVRAQRQPSGWVTKEALRAAYRHMVISERVLYQIGPAVNSGKSFLIYGQAGNGKTYMAEALVNLINSYVYLPHALECQGVIIKLFDPVYHPRAPENEEWQNSLAFERPHDGRWVLCRRPFIVTGGELTLDMLDLSYNPAAKIYDAPFQLKANNGIYLIDDFGRQKATPAEVLNRWIVPMDRHVDYLSFHTGGKVEVPFETFLIFSTNLRPENLGDEAFLRRIQYKMLLRNPNEEEYLEIFRRYCEAERLEFGEELIRRFIRRRYHQTGQPFRRCQPRDIITHAIDLLHFEKLGRNLTDDVLDRAFDSCFVDSHGLDD